MRVIDFFDRAVDHFSARACLMSDERSWTYREVQQASSALAAWLAHNVTCAAPRVAVLSPNCAETVVAVLAIFRLGAVWVPTNAKMPAEEIGAFLATTRSQILLAHPELQHLARRAADIAGCPVVVLPDVMSMPAPKSEPPTPSWRTDDIATLFATGGTTGSPKAAAWSHRTWTAQLVNFHAAVHHHGHPIHLVAAPISHAAGLVTMYMLAAGATTVVIDRAEPVQIMSSIETRRVTTLFLPPTVIYAMLAHPDSRTRDFSSLQNFIYAAAPMSVDKLKDAMAIFGPVMVQTFGQAEAPMLCTVLTRDDHIEAFERNDDCRLASCGRPGLLTQVAIVDADGRPLPAGSVGEIVVKGDLLMTGYFENAVATAACRLNDGWQRTGDIGVVDSDGFVSITDRKRDMIITGGFNVYPSQIEHVLWSHEAVQDCAVIGCPDERWGEAVLGVVQLKPGQSCDAGTLIAYCKQRLGSIRAPKRIEFWVELPRSPVGKVLKRTIRDHYWLGKGRKI